MVDKEVFIKLAKTLDAVTGDAGVVKDGEAIVIYNLFDQDNVDLILHRGGTWYIHDWT